MRFFIYETSKKEARIQKTETNVLFHEFLNYIYSGTSNSGHFGGPSLVAVALEVTDVWRFYMNILFFIEKAGQERWEGHKEKILSHATDLGIKFQNMIYNEEIYLS